MVFKAFHCFVESMVPPSASMYINILCTPSLILMTCPSSFQEDLSCYFTYLSIAGRNGVRESGSSWYSNCLLRAVYEVFTEHWLNVYLADVVEQILIADVCSNGQVGIELQLVLPISW